MDPLLGLAAVGGLITYAYMTSGPGNLVSVASRIDGREYMVQNLPDKEEAADRLAEIRRDISKVLFEYKQPEYSQDQACQILIKRFNPDNLMENDVASQHTSYSENKGEKIVICLRHKDQQGFPLVDKNTVMFVVLHECAHLMTFSNGHTQEFWNNFRRLLQDSMKLGVYNEVNYSRTPTAYCGMMITDSPL
jgi:predicted metal-dependent hydrolase